MKSRAFLPEEARRTNCTVAAFSKSFSTSEAWSFVCRGPTSKVKLTALLPMIARSISWTFSKSTRTWFIGGWRSAMTACIQVLCSVLEDLMERGVEKVGGGGWGDGEAGFQRVPPGVRMMLFGARRRVRN